MTNQGHLELPDTQETSSPPLDGMPRKRPSILFINRVYPPARGATGRMVRDLAREFVRDGWNVTILCADGQPKSFKFFRVISLGLTVEKKSSLKYALIWLGLFFKALRMKKHDVVVTLSDPPMIYVGGSLLKLLRGSKHIHWCQDLYPDILPAIGKKPPKFVYAILSWLSTRALKRADRVVAIGRCMGRILAKKVDAKGKVSVIPNWPDQVLVDEELNERIRTRSAKKKTKKKIPSRPFEEQLKNELPKFKVLYAGHLGMLHDHTMILEAAIRLDHEQPDIEFVMVGDGPAFGWLARERAKRGLENIRFIPFQPYKKLPDIMHSGDLHLVLLKDKALGMAVPSKFYSAIAAGRPCIYAGPEGSEVAEVIHDFGVGAAIPAHDSDILVDCILHYRRNSDAWFQAQAAAEEAREIFTPAEMTKAWIKRARDVLQNTEF